MEAKIYREHKMVTDDKGDVVMKEVRDFVETDNFSEQLIPISFTGGFNKSYRCRNIEFENKSFAFYWLKITKYIKPGNYIGTTVIRGRRPATENDLLGIMGCCLSVCRRFITECKRRGYVKTSRTKDGENIYFINPAYEFTGKNISFTLFALFLDDRVFVESLAQKTVAYLSKHFNNDFFDGCGNGDLEIDFSELEEDEDDFDIDE